MLIALWCICFLSPTPHPPPKAGMNLRKVNRHVDFPLILDLAPFCSASCKVVSEAFPILCDILPWPRYLNGSVYDESPWLVLVLETVVCVSVVFSAKFPLLLTFFFFFFLILNQNLAAGERVLYSLYGIVEHSGSMRGGHYTAYVKVRAPQRKTEQHHKNLSGQGPALLSSFKTFYLLFSVSVVL